MRIPFDGVALRPPGDPGAATNLRRWALAVGIAYLFLGTAALLHGGEALHAPDEFEYLAIGRNLAQHGRFSMDGVTPTAWRSPGLPALIAVLWLIWPSVWLFKLVNVGCWAATGFLIARLAARLFGAASGILSAALYLAYVLELYAATTLYPQTLAGLLAVAAASLVLTPGRLSPLRQLVLLATGLFQILVIPNCIVVTGLTYLYALLAGKLRWLQVAFAGLVILGVVLGWCARNERAVGGFGFTTSMGITLYDGNRSHVTAATAGSKDSLNDGQGRTLTEVEVDRRYRKVATDWIRAHPLDAADLAIQKLFYWFAYTNNYETQRGVPLMGLLSLWAALIYYPVLLGALLAVAFGRTEVRVAAVLAWGVYLTAILTYVLFLTRLRYRLPFDPLLFALGPGAFLAVARGFWLSRLRVAGRILAPPLQ